MCSYHWEQLSLVKMSIFWSFITQEIPILWMSAMALCHQGYPPMWPEKNWIIWLASFCFTSVHSKGPVPHFCDEARRLQFESQPQRRVPPSLGLPTYVRTYIRTYVRAVALPVLSATSYVVHTITYVLEARTVVVPYTLYRYGFGTYSIITPMTLPVLRYFVLASYVEKTTSFLICLNGMVRTVQSST